MASDRDILPAGKLPADLLADLLPGLPQADPRVIVGPRVGTDAAAIDFESHVLILKSDPITFATDDAGWYLVNVNANDIACMGGKPEWLLVTALLPQHATTRRLVASIFESLQRACTELDITLIGGHTEITIGLDRPILVGSMVGMTSRDGLIDPASSRSGDVILLCNGIAIEGTALLATESPPERLSELSSVLIERCSKFLSDPGISVVRAARLLRESGARIHAMHDPTEGGLASALRELMSAADLGVRVDLDRVLVYSETQEICNALGIDPFGLIASGALVAVVDADDAAMACRYLAAAGIACAEIGHMTSGTSGLQVNRSEVPAELPAFEVDELARFLATT